MRLLTTILFFVASLLSSYAQSNHNINGYVRDASSGEGLIGAVVQVRDSKISTSTNSYGFFSLNIPDSTVKLIISYVGYESLEVDITGKVDRQFNFELTSLDNVLEEVVVTGKKEIKMSPALKWVFLTFLWKKLKMYLFYLGSVTF